MLYYGATKTGNRLHMGDFVLKSTRREDWVETFCGQEMGSWDELARPPMSRVSEFCKNCFRTYAFQTLEAISSSNGFVARLEASLDSARLEDWSNERLLRELNSLAREIREGFALPEPVLPRKRQEAVDASKQVAAFVKEQRHAS